MILVAIGANLPSSYGLPVQACDAAVQLMKEAGLRIDACSSWYESAPVPVSDQPWYINGVASVQTELNARECLDLLHQIENHMGRIRTVPNAPRVIDLDLLAYNDERYTEQTLMVPHPRLHERAFVVLPLAEIAPGWRHPITGQCVREMAAALPTGQEVRRRGVA